MTSLGWLGRKTSTQTKTRILNTFLLNISWIKFLIALTLRNMSCDKSYKVNLCQLLQNVPVYKVLAVFVLLSWKNFNFTASKKEGKHFLFSSAEVISDRLLTFREVEWWDGVGRAGKDTCSPLFSGFTGLCTSLVISIHLEWNWVIYVHSAVAQWY